MSNIEVDIKAQECICERCGHKWTSNNIPNACSKCKSKYWNRKRLRGVEKTNA